jgi:ribulose 1,5-bisphosphate synthetase/thiazole synthase
MWKKLLSVVLVVTWLMVSTSLPAFADSEQTAEENMYTYDIVIYGGNASGVIAAIKAAQLGKTVAVVEPNPYRIGGLTTGAGHRRAGRYRCRIQRGHWRYGAGVL